MFAFTRRVGTREAPATREGLARLGLALSLPHPAVAAWRSARRVPAELAPAWAVREFLRMSARRWLTLDRIPPFPWEATVPLRETSDVILWQTSALWDFLPEIHAQEVAFATELARRGRAFAVVTEPDVLFGKNVFWFVHTQFLRPRAWDHNQQVREFAAALERQGNRLSSSNMELALWENKAHMHRRLDEIGVETPPTVILTADTWPSVPFDFEPVVLKEDHSCGSAGIHYLPTASDARRFVSSYTFRPNESLIMQQVVPGATRDARITVVGDRCIDSSSYWRIKSPEALNDTTWTTTATTYNSQVVHGDIPESARRLAIHCTKALGLRRAGLDLMWPEDDSSREPLVLEISPVFQPNPPKPDKYQHLSYKQFKHDFFAPDGYLERQYHVHREIASSLLEQCLV